MQQSASVLVVNGPNLAQLGEREPGIYGDRSLDQIITGLREFAAERGFQIQHFQSDLEGELVSRLQRAVGEINGLIINPGGLAHTSVVLHDAIRSLGDIPKVEVHLSNPSKREEFRQRQITAAACDALIAGAGPRSYTHALREIAHILSERAEELAEG